MAIRILLVSQYPPFEQYAQELRRAFPEIEVEVYKKLYLDDTAAFAAHVSARRYDGIVVFGFIYRQVADLVDVPVINAEPSVPDLLFALEEVRRTRPAGSRVSLFSYADFEMFRHDRKELVSLLEARFSLRIDVIQYDSLEEFETLLFRCLQSGDGGTVVCGYYGLEVCARRGCQGVLLYAGYNTLAAATRKIIDLTNARRAEVLKKNRLSAILDFASEGILYTDADGSIELINPAGRGILGLPEGEPLAGKTLGGVMGHRGMFGLLRSGQPELEQIVTLRSGTQIITNIVPVVSEEGITGAVATFQETAQVTQMEKKIRTKLSRKGSVAKYHIEDIIGESPQLTACKRLVKRLGGYDVSVLIHGETGTGKELFAQSIHNESTRRDGPFYAINCATLPGNLLESELFGYTDGAFTGASKGGKAGLFELAHGGTLYLDEIGEMSLPFQSQLLRVLQEKEVRRIGDDKVTPIDVRIIAASHKNLYQEVKEQRFREDLYYRIDVMDLEIPPLRERPEDILTLLEFYLEFYRERFQCPAAFTFDGPAKSYLSAYPWRGNVRELENFVERVYIHEHSSSVLSLAVVEELLQGSRSVRTSPRRKEGPEGIQDNLNEVTMKLIREALERFGGNQTQAARSLGVSRTYIWRKLNEQAGK